MRVVAFVHSLLSDWNHGNAHFLRGVFTELVARGHDVHCWEPADAWSLQNLLRDHGPQPLRAFADVYPLLAPRQYDLATFDLDAALDGADIVLVHEWNDPALVASVGAARARGGAFTLLFHDTHHRAITAPAEMARYDLRHYDGVLAFGAVLRDLYMERGWTQRAWVWHEAADTRLFRPLHLPPEADLAWIGNWGDDERSAELHEFLLGPVQALGLRATVHGVRYPADAVARLEESGIAHRGWLPNFAVPRVFAQHRVTVHVPRRPYVEALPGIPTIRPFEALACGIPLVSAPWHDTEALFRPGTDYLVARNGSEMREQLRAVLHDASLAASLAVAGRHTILQKHTCGHRADELLAICAALRAPGSTAPAGATALAAAPIAGVKP